jgi:phage terminase large subunit GpA-like protein
VTAAPGEKCDLSPTTGYLRFQEESHRRYGRGERQNRCPHCFHYYWPQWPEDAAMHGITVAPDYARPAEAMSPCLNCNQPKRAPKGGFR